MSAAGETQSSQGPKGASPRDARAADAQALRDDVRYKEAAA